MKNVTIRSQYRQSAARTGICAPGAGGSRRPPRDREHHAAVVFERTREIGLLRAVGMRRRQVRTMVRSESVIISVFGAILGIVMGTGLGIALVASLRQQGIGDLAVPETELVLFLVLSGVLALSPLPGLPVALLGLMY